MSVQADAAKLALDALMCGEVDVLDLLHAPDYVDHTPLPGHSSGTAGLRERAMTLSSAFCDARVTADVLLDEGDTVVLQARARGVHKGEFFGVAGTGRKIEAVGICVFRFVDGLISQSWSSFDFAALVDTLRSPVAARAVPHSRGPLPEHARQSFPLAVAR
jgi:predicted ester cyclase